jgi:hypothetical protein
VTGQHSHVFDAVGRAGVDQPFLNMKDRSTFSSLSLPLSRKGDLLPDHQDATQRENHR